MPELLLIGDDEIAELLDLEELARALETALRSISLGAVDVPPRSAARAPSGWLGAMPGFAGGRLGAKLVSVYPDNPARGQPSHQGVIVLFDAETGRVSALLGAARITAMRTAMTTAVAARGLAASTRQIAVLGGGVQAESHLEAFAHLFPGSRLTVAARSEAAARALARERGVEVAASFEEAVRGADVVCCCTDARSPILVDSWLGPGCHVSSVGSGEEVPAETVERAELFVESRTALLPPPAGSCELAGRPPESVTEVGEVLAGLKGGRSSPAALTFYKSMGHAAEDLAASGVVLAEAARRHGGQRVSL